MEGKSISSDRGQSSVMGVVLVVSIAVMGVVAILLTGLGAIDASRQSAQLDNAQHAMSKFDSQAALVALGSSNNQWVSVTRGNDGQLTVNDTAGKIELVVVSGATQTTIAEANLGSMSYEVGDTALAYQGGGVWRYKDGNSTVVSPPEYHYRDQTLTFPIIRVTGESGSVGANGEVLITKRGTDQLYPTASNTNPLDSGHIHVKITSKYHQGWNSYFESRTEGGIDHNPTDQTVAVNLTVPVTETFDNAVTTTSDQSDAIEETGNADIDPPHETGGDSLSASPKVDDKITKCESDGCNDLSSELADGLLENGTYYENGDVSVNETEYDTSSGAIHVVVNGDLEFAGSGGPPGTSHHRITGNNQVTFYVNGDVSINGNTGVNTDGESKDLLVLVHSTGGDVATASGTPQFKGLIYAPNSSLTINGGGGVDNIIGAVVVRNVTAHGNADLVFEHPVTFEMEFDTMTEITYLHVTENRIEVTDG